MNKYSVTFIDKISESNFQKQRNQDIRMPIFKAATIGMLLICILKLIIDIMHQHFQSLPILVTTSTYMITSIIVIHYFPKYIQYALMIFNYLLTYYEQDLMSTISDAAIPLFVNDFTICTIIIILVIDALNASFLVFSTYGYKLTITILNDTSQSYNVYAACCALMIFLCFCSYRLNIESRQNFLLTKKDNLWVQILPKIVEQPFILLQFDRENFKYIFLTSSCFPYKCENQGDLKDFLSQWKYNSETLQNFLFQLDNEETINQNESISIQISNQKDKLFIKINLINYQLPTYVISLATNINQLNKQNQNIKKLVKLYEQKQQIIFKFIYQKIDNILNKEQRISKIKLIQFRNNCYRQILNLKLNKDITEIKFDTFKTLLIKLSNLFQFKNINIIINSVDFLEIYTLKYHMLLLLYEIFVLSQKNSVIQLDFRESCSTITYQGKNINKNKINFKLQQVIEILVSRSVKIFSDQFVLYLNQQPQKSFLI